MNRHVGYIYTNGNVLTPGGTKVSYEGRLSLEESIVGLFVLLGG